MRVRSALCLAAILAPAGAAEALDRWVILSAIEGELPNTLGADLEGSVREASRYRIGLEIEAPERVFVEGGTGAERALNECAADVPCIAKTLATTRATHALLWVARRSAGSTLLALRLVDVRSAEVRHQAVRAVGASESIPSVGAALAVELLDALGHTRGGSLIVKATPADAEVVVLDATAARVTPPLLPTGSYELVVSRDGYETTRRAAQVEADREVIVEVALVEHSSIVDSPWLWLGASAVVVAVGAGVVWAATSVDRCFCASVDRALCTACP